MQYLMREKGYIIQLPVPSNKIGGDGEDDFEYIPFGARRKKSDKPKQVIKDEYVENAVFSIEGEDELDFLDD